MKPYRQGETVRVIAVDERRIIEEVRTGKVRHTGEIRHYITRSDAAPPPGFVHHKEAPADAIPCESAKPGPYKIAHISRTYHGSVISLHSVVGDWITGARVDDESKVDPDYNEPTNPHAERARGKLVADMLLMIEDFWTRSYGELPTAANLERLTQEQWRLIRAMVRATSPDKVPSETTQRMVIDAYAEREKTRAMIREHGANAFAQMCAEQQEQGGKADTCATCGEVHTVEDRAAVGGGCPKGES